MTDPDANPDAPEKTLELRVVLPLGVVAVGLVVASLLYFNPPKAKRRSEPPRLIEVEVRSLLAGPYQILVPSQGTVRARTRSLLGAEVSGRVLSVSPSFQDGAVVEAGESLVRVDPVEYELALQESENLMHVATSTLASLEVELEAALKRIALAEERVALQTGQLERVRGLKAKGVASDEQMLDAEARELTAREGLQARVDERRTLVAKRVTLGHEQAGAEQRLAKARLDLARTEIKAPFRARVVRRLVGEGQFVARGAEVGEIYAVGRLEIRLPLTARQLSFVDLPQGGDGVRVVLSDAVGEERHTWEGRITRAEGVVDRSSRQLAVIAELNPSESKAAGAKDSGGRGHEQEDSRGRPPIRPGTFLTGRVYGRVLPKAYVLPRSASMADDVVLIADAEGLLRRRKLSVAWRTPQSLVVTEGLSDGELLCTTPLVFAGESLKVNVKQAEPASDGEVPE